MDEIFLVEWSNSCKAENFYDDPAKQEDDFSVATGA